MVSREAYLRIGEEHTRKDIIIGNEEIKQIQKKINGHCSMWTRMLSMGKNWKQEERIRRCLITKSENIAPGKITIKDHKKRKEGEFWKGRMMVSGNMGMQLPFSNTVAEMVESCANRDARDGIEVNSGEHLMHRIDKSNMKI